VLGEARGRVGMVMLNAHELRVLLDRPLRCDVVRVEVVRDQLGLDAKHCEIELEVRAEGLVGRLGVQVAQMRRDERLHSARHAESAFELRTGGHDRQPCAHR
jgi:hypothetical protein